MTNTKAIIIALALSVASLFAGAQTVQSATILAGELGPTIPAGWEIISVDKVREGQVLSNTGISLSRASD